jgi:hypothetical protein
MSHNVWLAGSSEFPFFWNFFLLELSRHSAKWSAGCTLSAGFLFVPIPFAPLSSFSFLSLLFTPIPG